MEVKFLQNLYDELFEQQLRNRIENQGVFEYVEIVIRVCRRIRLLLNNSRISIQTLCSYISSQLMQSSQQQKQKVLHPFIQQLNKRDKFIKYFTHIAIRFILLSHLCKLGYETKLKQWKIGLKQLINETRIQFMFNSHQSLAQVLVTTINKLQQICNQVPFYQILIALFYKYDLEYSAKKIQQKLNEIRQSWKKNNIENTKNSSKVKKGCRTQNKISRTACKKAVEKNGISLQQPKNLSNENFKKRISDFRDLQKKRLSQHLQSRRRRTIFQSRKYLIKMESNQQYYQQQTNIVEQLIKDEKPIGTQNKQDLNKNVMEVKWEKVEILKEDIKKQNNKISAENDVQNDYLAPSTPPKRKK